MALSRVAEITIVGGTGFIGRTLAQRLVVEGHAVRIASRRSDAEVPAGCELVPSTPLPASRVVINLAGEPIIGRWTRSKWARIESSRLDLTRRLVEGFGADEPPEVLINASAVGFYGDGGEEELREEDAAGADRAAVLCQAWEKEAQAAIALGVRVVTPRIGLVLGAHGGALGAMLPAFKLGMGGPLGSGRQWQPWIHVEDAVAGIQHCIEQPVSGAVNLVGPEPVRQQDFARALGRALGRPAVVPAPAWALRLALGEAADLLLASQRVVPGRLLQSGFIFRFPEISGALADLLSRP